MLLKSIFMKNNIRLMSYMNALRSQILLPVRLLYN